MNKDRNGFVSGIFVPWFEVPIECEEEMRKHEIPIDIDLDSVEFSNHSILSTENPDPQSWIRSFMAKDD